MSHRRPLLPHGGNQSPPPSNAKPSNKRRGPACEPCRAKRTACNGVRPICASCAIRRKTCHYATKDSAETRLQALQREHKAFAKLVECLRTTPAITAQTLLYELRRSSSPLSVLGRYESSQMLKNPSETPIVLSTLPQIHSKTELRLMVRHPIAYPALNLSYNSITSKRTLVDPPEVFAIEKEAPSMPNSSSAGPQEVFAGQHTQHNDDCRGRKQNRKLESSASRYLDALADHLRIDYWTSISVTNRYAAGAISQYMETEHPMLRLFDAEAFLNDLINLRGDFCSAFLVNSLLAFASQIYCRTDPTAAVRSMEFEMEARMLSRAGNDDSLPNLAGLMFLYISMANNGSGNQGAAKHLFEAGEMAKRMKLFGVYDRLTALQSHSLTEEALFAFRQTAWGVFNVYNLCVHHWVAQPLEYAPALPIPDKPDEVGFDVARHRFVRLQGTTTPTDEAYMYLCRLCSIDSEALIILRDPNSKRPPPLAFASSKYEKLLDLIDSLPENVARYHRAPTAVLFFHMYFHRCVMDLFRPYVAYGKAQQFKSHPPNFDTPEAIFQASIQQLKSLLIEYTAVKHFASNLMWHPTLFYIANGVLETPSSPEWRFFFLLCIHCYSAIYDSYPFAESAMHSLLSMATNFNSISTGEAENILRVTLHKKKRFQRKHRTQGHAVVTESPFAMSDGEVHAASTMAKRLQDLSLLGQFTENVLYGMKAKSGLHG